MAERPVSENESLDRYILRKGFIRSDGRVKPDAFIPYSRVELSVTRHLNLSENDIWALGESVAGQTGTTLHGRADCRALTFIKHRLRVVADPQPWNSNHANVTDWPVDKQAQIEIAVELVKEIQYLPKPTV